MRSFSQRSLSGGHRRSVNLSDAPPYGTNAYDGNPSSALADARVEIASLHSQLSVKDALIKSLTEQVATGGREGSGVAHPASHQTGGGGGPVRGADADVIDALTARVRQLERDLVQARAEIGALHVQHSHKDALIATLTEQLASSEI